MSDDKLVKHDGNFSKALRGEEPLVIGNVLQRSWEITVRGLPVMLPLVVLCVLISILINYLLAPETAGTSMFEVAADPELQAQTEWARYLTDLIVAPLWGGLILLGILNANDEKLSFGAFGVALQRSLQLIAVTFVKLFIPAAVGFLVMFLLGGFSVPAAIAIEFIVLVVVNITFMLAAPLVVHRNTSVFKSIMGSVLVLRRYFWRVLGLMIILGIIVLISMLPLFLGLLFTLPLTFNVMGVLYITLLGARDDNRTDAVIATNENVTNDSQTLDNSSNE